MSPRSLCASDLDRDSPSPGRVGDFDLIERFEDFFEKLFFDSDTVVLDCEQHLLVLGSKLHPDGGTGELDGIGEQVADNLVQGFRVDVAQYLLFGQCERNVYAP